MVCRRPSLAIFGLLVWLGLGLATPGPTGAASGNWTVKGAPLVLNYGSPSTIDVTITGGTRPIGCIEVMLTSKDAADSATITLQPLPATWTATIVHGGRDEVVLTAASNFDRLALPKVLTVAIQVTTTGQQTEKWQVTGHQGESTDSSTNGLGTKTISPIVVIGAGPTPTPTPTQRQRQRQSPPQPRRQRQPRPRAPQRLRLRATRRPPLRRH